MGRRTTLKDVARKAGVTAATVSYVINNTPGQSIRLETRERVLKAARELNYMPEVSRLLRIKKAATRWYFVAVDNYASAQSMG